MSLVSSPRQAVPESMGVTLDAGWKKAWLAWDNEINGDDL